MAMAAMTRRLLIGCVRCSVVIDCRRGIRRQEGRRGNAVYYTWHLGTCGNLAFCADGCCVCRHARLITRACMGLMVGAGYGRSRAIREYEQNLLSISAGCHRVLRPHKRSQLGESQVLDRGAGSERGEVQYLYRRHKEYVCVCLGVGGFYESYGPNGMDNAEDRLDEGSSRGVDTKTVEEFALQHDADVFETSAKTGENINELFLKIARDYLKSKASGGGSGSGRGAPIDMKAPPSDQPGRTCC